MLSGFLFPRTESGRSSLLPPPPWNYSGDLLTIEYRTDPAAIRRVLPEPLSLVNDDEDPGAVAVIFADWQSSAADQREFVDPIRMQYKEAFVVVRCRYAGQIFSRCIYIWVDTDFAIARGNLQGYPKKLGSIHQSRPVSVGRGGPRLEKGGLFAGTLAAYDRRLITASVTLEEQVETGGFVNGHAMLHHRWMPKIELNGEDTISELVTMRGVNVELGPIWSGTPSIELGDSPVEELTDLAPREMLGGYWQSVGTTFAGGTTLETGVPSR